MSKEMNNTSYFNLTNLLEERKIQAARADSRVTLPDLDVHSHSGLITVDKEHDCNLFFWFFPCTKVSPENAPLIVYLNGGPGNSSLIGLFEEVGPIRVDENGQVRRRAVTWTDHFSVVFVDNPVGVGFSYCQPEGKVRTNKVVANHLFSFLQQFLQIFSEFQGCDLYIGGISYAGKYVPTFAYKIDSEMKRAGPGLRINLKGIFIGSGLTDPGKMLPHHPSFLVSLGMITEKKGKELQTKITSGVEKHKQLGQHEEAVKDVLETIFTQNEALLGYKGLDNLLSTKKNNWSFVDFLNQPGIQSAIHARPTKYIESATNLVLEMAEDFFSGVGEQLSFIMDKYKVLVFTGHMDLLVSVPMTEVLLKSLTWSGSGKYLAAEKHKWLDREGEVAGYVTKVKNFTRVVMRNAGHRAARDQPAWTLDMMVRFIHDKSFFE